ncbi:MAG TPA: hypothetical protein VIJ18_10755 [Microbacteriaceae bacterium]
MITTEHRSPRVQASPGCDRQPVAERAERTVWLRLFGHNDELQLVPLNVARVCDDTEAIRQGGRVIGYIRHVDRIFVALVGARLDRAEECGQSPLWDYAATRVLQEANAHR